MTTLNEFTTDPAVKINNDKMFFYPCAGADWKSVLRYLHEFASEFWFVDKGDEQTAGEGGLYCDLKRMPTQSIRALLPDYKEVESRIDGTERSQITERKDEKGRTYRHVEPGALIQIFEHTRTKRQIKVIRKRGFGQTTLHEFGQNSIGIFMHRGDSDGEGGSNIRFFNNMESHYQPIANLYEQLCNRIVDGGLIITDGSNCDLKQLRRDPRTSDEVTTQQAFEHAKDFVHGPLKWHCVGHLDKRYGPTLIWQVHKIS